MIGLLQRVRWAQIVIDGQNTAMIGPGLLVLVGVQRDDCERDADRLLARLLGYRVFADDNARMNRCLREHGGGLLLVPQFTLAADTRKGARPSFSTAAAPAAAAALFDYLLAAAKNAHRPVAAGRFGADMQVELANDGPVTFWLET